MEFQARFPAVTARAATFEDDGVRIMVLFKDGLPVEIIQADLFDVVYAPCAAAPEPSRSNGKRAYTRKPKEPEPEFKFKKPAAEKKRTAAHEAPLEGSTNDAILQAIRKKPLSSPELIDALKLKDAPHRVYEGTAALKNKGLIESRTDDENDGIRRWYPNVVFKETK